MEKKEGLRKFSRADNYPIVVHSHLGWDWVWQRPQQFISRFSSDTTFFSSKPVRAGFDRTETPLADSATSEGCCSAMQLPANR